MQVRMLSDDEVRRLLDLDELLEALARGFSALSAGRVSAPPRNGVDVPAGFMLSMVAHAPDHPMGVKLVSVFHGNHHLGLPGHLALISLFDERTGAPLAVMNGTYITAMRTAGGAALSTRLLARPDSRTLAVIGAGVQGAAHVRMLSRVRDFTDIRVVSASLGEAQQLAAGDARITAMASAEDGGPRRRCRLPVHDLAQSRGPSTLALAGHACHLGGLHAAGQRAGQRRARRGARVRGDPAGLRRPAGGLRRAGRP